jgi:NADH-quinone oxidoreductase subunit A
VEFFQIFLVFAIAAGVGVLLIGIPSLIAPRRSSAVKLEPFECGKDPVSLPEGRFPIKFSTIAIFFIIFDIEMLFLWPWAGACAAHRGWFLFGEMMVFLGILMLGFLYVWKKRGLEWE